MKKVSPFFEKLFLVPLVLFLIAFILKFTHLPGSGLLMVIIAGLSLLTGIISQIVYAIKGDPIGGLIRLTINILLIYLVFRLMYWTMAQPVFYAGMILFVLTMVLSLVKQVQMRMIHYGLVTLFVFNFVLSFVKAHKIYYTMNLTETFHSTGRNLSPLVWDKYSWFLYLAGETDKAMEANAMAIKIAERERYMNNLTVLQQRREMIKLGMWQEYYQVQE
jgi:hypothetical protein